MHRSSESIAALAAALAKAQCELSNPEKSLVGTIGGDRPGEGARSFRYAPLSSGLDIVRKALGQQQIATVQTTAIDAATGTISLTTVLAHASGEWIASDWPVCRVADIAAPHRMGAALTYARRYALFTLVGIAGEDDLDAPDLAGRPQPGQNGGKTLIDVAVPDRRRGLGNGKDRGRPALDPDTSAALRDALVREVASIGSPAEAAHWARTALPAKNRLTASDARLVEVAFELRLSSFDIEGPQPEARPASAETREATNPSSASSSPQSALPDPRSSDGGGAAGHPAKSRGIDNRRIDKSVLAIGEPRRYRDKAHLQFVASQSCLVCGRRPCDPHHLRFAQARALGRKVSDEFTVPLCRLHHREVHRARNEADWWSKLGIDALATALKLWKTTRSTNEPAPPATAEPIAAGPPVDSAALEKARARPRPQRRAATKPAETVPPRA